jgi:type II secretory ATPase GspE/PulE/Tfp pilus assembly ATPase PilB-like protein
VCSKCSKAADIKIIEPGLKALGIDGDEAKKIHVGAGCEVCRNTGYKGRTGIFEVLSMNHEIASLLNQRAPLAEIRDAAIAGGMTTMREDAKAKVLAGITTPEEAIRSLASLC